MMIHYRFLIEELRYGGKQVITFVICVALSIATLTALNSFKRDVHGSLIDEARDLRIDVKRASGPGGQKVNKTSSCVQLRHGPSGTEVRCQRSRSRELNRYYARKELCDRIAVINDRRVAAIDTEDLAESNCGFI